ncbi:MAG: sensor histidine kinase [Bryobacteraceae bacterium]
MIGKRRVLRTGFGVVIGLLILPTISAYRIQESFSERTVAIHHRYVRQEEITAGLRHILWVAGIAARDFFLNTKTDRAEIYLDQLKTLRKDTEPLFADLKRIRGTDKVTRELEAKFEDMWLTLTSSVITGLADSEEYSFVQEEIVPRNNAAGALLLHLQQANERSLTESEEEFASSRHAASQRLVILLGAGLLIGILVTRYSLKHSESLERQSASQLKEVSQAKLDLERLSARLMEIQEEERTRLSRELHDEIVQTLAVLKIEITQAQNIPATKLPEIREHLARARDLAERTLRTVRNITLLLRPSLLDDLGLGPALQWQGEDFRRRTGVTCELTETGLQDDLPDAVKTCVYRVTQEALHNCEKHASATKVCVDVVQTAHQLTVEVQDDGIGFQQTPDPPGQNLAKLHFGVLGMRERAAGLGGKLTMESAPGKGTTVLLEIPLAATTASETDAAVEAKA